MEIVLFSQVAVVPMTVLQWVPQIRHHCPDAPFIIGASKLDLLEGDNYTNQAPISHKEVSSRKYLPYVRLNFIVVSNFVGSITKGVRSGI